MSQFSSNGQEYEEYRDEYVLNDSEKQLILAMARNDLGKVKEILSDLEKPEEINLFITKDRKCYTILHLATLNHHLDIIKLAINYAKAKRHQMDEFEFKNKMVEWINAKSFEGFTALHLASFRGDLAIIEELVLNGSKIQEVNDQGLNCLHIAAQGDQPVSLVYFKNEGLDISSKDYKGSTPLHWASYIGCENAVNYLVNWPLNINEKDLEGELTPLHLAVISGNTRVVRKLLIKGSDKTLVDKQGKTPAALAKENGYHNIQKMLQAKVGCAELCNIAPVFRPMKKKKRSVIIFLCLFVLVNLLIILFDFPYIEDYEWFILYAILNFFSLIFFLISWKTNPGFLEQNPNKNLLDLLRKYDCASVCPECELVKIARSKHCEICGKCVSVYDHHCPWINNCVGARNHGYFLSFIITVWSLMLFLLIMIFRHIYLVHPSDDYFPAWNSLDDMEFYPFKLVMNVIDAIIMMIFFFPLSFLIYVQINNFILNKTTPERYGFNVNSKNESRSVSNSNETNPSFIDLSKAESKKSLKIRRNLGCCDYFKNCYTMCCLNGKEKLAISPDESKNSLLLE